MFEKDFLLGAATAAHQVEGNNIHSDYWTMEHMKYGGFAEPSGKAADHYNRYQEDIRLLSDAGLNAYRFSVKWARIEPEKGVFDERETRHYLDVIRFCKECGITPIVALHHFTSPKWLIAEGGWETESTVEAFRRYCVYIAERLGGELEYVCTINEANIGMQLNSIAERYMKRMMAGRGADGQAQVGVNLEHMLEHQKNAATENLAVFGTSKPHTFVSPRTPEGDLVIMRAHAAARDAIKAICPHLKVGLSLSLHDIQAMPGGEHEAERMWKEEFGRYLPYIKDDDFLGIQNYTRSRVDQNGQMEMPEGAELTQMNYEFYPEALENVIRRVAREFHGDLIVTENGLATADDSRRVKFIRRALQGIRSCMADGLPVKGYCYWSLLDNFEWQKGFSMTFGLIAVDRDSQRRTAKPSLSYLGKFRKREETGR